MANQSKLKAWVRYDGNGRVISGGPIFQVNKPKVGNWRQIDANLCCNGGSSTTTTTTNGGGGTPTAFIKTTWGNTYAACVTTGIPTLFYSASSTLTAGITVFLDAALTIPVNEGVVIDTGMMSRYVVGVGGVLSIFECSTTTTTTTQGPTLSFVGTGGNSTVTACSPGGTSTYYTTGPLQYGVYPQNGNVVYFDEALTQPGIGTIFDCNNGVLSNERPCQ